MENQPNNVAEDVVVSLEYSLTVDGEVVDTTENRAPLQYIHGRRNIIQGLERELTGLKLGESKEVLVKAADGYGEYDPSAFVAFERSQFPPGFDIEIGAEIHVRGGNGQAFPARISGIDGDNIRLDLNHPLAGKDLLFSTKIVDLREATDSEKIMGQLGGGCSGCGDGGCSSEGCSSGCC